MDLESARLKLVEISWDDVAEIHRLHSFPEVDEYNTIGLPKTIDETKEVIRPMIDAQKSEKRKLFLWKILLKETDEFIGVAGINLSLDRFRLGEIYYKLLPAKWRNGYATEVSRTLVKTGFDVFKLHKVEAGVATENIASIRVLEKSGMTREGLQRKILPIRGEWKDSFHYAIVEDDLRDY